MLLKVVWSLTIQLKNFRNVEIRKKHLSVQTKVGIQQLTRVRSTRRKTATISRDHNNVKQKEVWQSDLYKQPLRQVKIMVSKIQQPHQVHKIIP